MSDYHLAYVPGERTNGVDAAYDVYPIERGLQLGIVTRRDKIWTARDFDGREKVSSARWMACAALWPEDRQRGPKVRS